MERHPSNPFVSTNSSPSCSLNFGRYDQSSLRVNRMTVLSHEHNENPSYHLKWRSPHAPLHVSRRSQTATSAPQRTTFHHFLPLIFLFYINSGKIARSFFYFIFKIFPKMQHFYAHFPPFLYQFLYQKRENLFCRFSPFLYFLFCFFHWFLSLRMGCLPTG